ncbi:hypothetical protein [Corynebacterium cystitidis]|uniref:hypothetical protein n=1 Tax=Corynebacterium cystitidis TaxID=35757 RepID=UPI00211F063C|nr:hypothetical protein [Corynebacterium cystitidis]
MRQATSPAYPMGQARNNCPELGFAFGVLTLSSGPFWDGNEYGQTDRDHCHEEES